MSSWAAIAKAEPPKPAPAPVVEVIRPSVAVIDANAIINGSGLLNLMASTEKVVTIPEVLREVRDKQSRAALEALPFTIHTQEPTEESVKAVVTFARATGDLHALSAVDTRLLALAHALEVSYYGGAHLRDRPPPPRVQKKRISEAKALPGWGAEGGDWAAIDRLNEEEEAAAAAAITGGGASGAAAAAAAEAGASRIAAGVQQLSLGDDAAAATDGGLDPRDAAGDTDGSGTESEGEEGDGSGDDDDDWEVAAKTKNKARRAKRRSYRRAEAAAAALDDLEVEGDEGGSGSGSDSESESDEEEGASAAGDADAGEEGPAHPAGESAVCCITADFAMQNVLLQMGLRLAAPDGRRLASVARWALRCSACFQVTKEVGRLFCPRCGNAALDKVRVVVGPGGAEQYGVKKRHVLRGTRFSLPKPRGGRARDPILREDQLLTKKHLLRAAAAAERAAADQLDPFAPEYTADTWHQAAALPGGGAGAAALLAGWKHNPNERKHRATNRRRK